MLGRLLVATIAGWLIYSFITRNAHFSTDQNLRAFGTQLFGSILGAIAFAWLFAPLSTIAIDNYAMQFVVRMTGILSCSLPVILLYAGMLLLLRRQ